MANDNDSTKVQATMQWVAEDGQTRLVDADDLILLGFVPLQLLQFEYQQLKAMQTSDRPGFMAWLGSFIKRFEKLQEGEES